MPGSKEPQYQKKPIVVNETAGTKFYCLCGLSENQPYCDGSHKGTNCSPVRVEIKEDRRVAYCGCRMSKELPFCDGTHTYL
ncbi:MAG: CDGSH iron-sulfur domain-containing protein [bacterium]|nr:CDGSH iron-sulfur domain-containing protein [bacterium]